MMYLLPFENNTSGQQSFYVRVIARKCWEQLFSLHLFITENTYFVFASDLSFTHLYWNGMSLEIFKTTSLKMPNNKYELEESNNSYYIA